MEFRVEVEGQLHTIEPLPHPGGHHLSDGLPGRQLSRIIRGQPARQG